MIVRVHTLEKSFVKVFSLVQGVLSDGANPSWLGSCETNTNTLKLNYQSKKVCSGVVRANPPFAHLAHAAGVCLGFVSDQNNQR